MKEVNENTIQFHLVPGTKSVIEFGAPWCAGCKSLKPRLALLEHNHPAVQFLYVDAETNPEYAAALGVQSLPTTLFFDGSELCDGVVGNVPIEALQRALAGIL